MSRQKRVRFAALPALDNVVDSRHAPPGWFDRVVGRLPLSLELGCGRGEYTLALARLQPHRAVIGVDRNGARLWKGACAAAEAGIANAHFLRSAVELLEDHLPPARVADIWLPFPDPLPKTRQAKHRLTSPAFLQRYRRLLRPGGAVYLKTDDFPLIRFAERSVHAVGGRVLSPAEVLARGFALLTSIQTTYEKRFRAEGRPIYDRAFCFDRS